MSLHGAWHVAIAQGVIPGQANTASWSLFLVLRQRYPHLLSTWAPPPHVYMGPVWLLTSDSPVSSTVRACLRFFPQDSGQCEACAGQ